MMKVVIDNAKVIIEDPSEEYLTILRERLSYKDMKVEYSLRRMAQNPFQKKSSQYKWLQKKLYGTMLIERENECEMPSGFFNLIPNGTQIVDHRKETGEKISLPWKKKPFDLRDYQDEAVSLMEDNYRGLINFATGLGKTLTALYAIRKIKRKTLILCPGVSIADNFYEELCSAFGEDKIGYFGGGKKKIRDITVGIAASVNNHIDKFVEADLGLIVVDEVHHLPADTFYSIADKLSGVGRIFGLTATDFRSDGKDIMIAAGAGPNLIKRDLVWGVKHGWLADPYIIQRHIQTEGREYRSDKLKNYKEHVLNSPEMTNRIISDCKKMMAAGKTVLCLVKEISHGKAIADAIGVPLATSADKQSTEYVRQLNEGKIPGLVGTDSKIGEGTDTKNVDVLVLANFVASKGPLWQNLGRGLRIHEGRDTVIVLDYIPGGSSMLVRHAKQRLDFFKQVTNNIKEC